MRVVSAVQHRTAHSLLHKNASAKFCNKLLPRKVHANRVSHRMNNFLRIKESSWMERDALEKVYVS